MARGKKVHTLKTLAKRKSKTKDAADTVETRRIEASQMALPTEERIQQHMATFEGYKSEIKKFQEGLKKAKDVCASEGIDPSTIEDAIRMKKKDPMKERRKYEEKAVAYKSLGLPFQLQVFDVAFESPVKQAEAEARQAAAAGRAPENRWPEGSEAALAYTAEYLRIQSRMTPGADHLTDDEIDGAVADGQAGIEDVIEEDA